MIHMNIINILGSVGVALMLVPYFLNLIKKLSVDSLWYSGLNFLGSFSCAIYSYYIEAYPLVVLEGTWAVMSAWAFIDDGIRAYKNKQQ